MNLSFRGYERPEGYEPGHTSLLIRDSVLEEEYWGGMPHVNYDELTRLFQDDLGLPAEKWTVKAHVGNAMGHINPPFDKLRESFHTPLTRTLHVGTYGGNGFMLKVIEGMVPIGDHHWNKWFYKRLGAGLIPIIGAVAVDVLTHPSALAGESIGVLGGLPGVILINGTASQRKERVKELMCKHANDIQFPYEH